MLLDAHQLVAGLMLQGEPQEVPLDVEEFARSVEWEQSQQVRLELWVLLPERSVRLEQRVS